MLSLPKKATAVALEHRISAQLSCLAIASMATRTKENTSFSRKKKYPNEIYAHHLDDSLSSNTRVDRGRISHVTNVRWPACNRVLCSCRAVNLKYETELHTVSRISLESLFFQPAVFLFISLSLSLSCFFIRRRERERERDIEAETDMKPQCSCVVYSGILLTWDPLGGFDGGGGGGRGSWWGWRMHNRTGGETGRKGEREREKKEKGKRARALQKISEANLA